MELLNYELFIILSIDLILGDNMIKRGIYKLLITIILVIFGTLLINKSNIIKNIIYEKIYNNYLNLAYIKKLYNNTIGDIIPFQNIIKEDIVFNEKSIYKEINKYNNGVSLKLNNNIVNSLDSGIVIFIGNKDNFNKTVIIENSNGVEEWYGNLDSINVNLYDYVDKNTILGNTKNSTLYLEFKKGDKYLDYKEFL